MYRLLTTFTDVCVSEMLGIYKILIIALNINAFTYPKKLDFIKLITQFKKCVIRVIYFLEKYSFNFLFNFIISQL